MQSLLILPSTPSSYAGRATSGRAPAGATPVVHGRRLIGHARFPFPQSLSAHMTVPVHQPSSVAQRESSAQVTDESTPRSNCGTRVIGHRAFTESRCTDTGAASKAKATVCGMWIMRYPANQESEAPCPITPAAPGCGPIQEGDAYVNPSNNGTRSPRVFVALAGNAVGAIDTTVSAQVERRLITQKPLGGTNEVGQVENRTYRLAGNVTDIRRKFMRIAVADGVVTAQEDAISRDLQSLEVALEQKADDERAAIALIRAGRSKHTKGIVTDLFPTIGPEAA